ncbi:unnamed protein product [Trichobilharzia regenti]|nr:unnamed protein product [Trichobilharzia regenti]
MFIFCAFSYSGNIEQAWSFENKVSSFRYLCHSNLVTKNVKVVVSRSNLLVDSFEQIMRLKAHELRCRLFISFTGEEGLDYGGLSSIFTTSIEFSACNIGSPNLAGQPLISGDGTPDHVHGRRAS